MSGNKSGKPNSGSGSQPPAGPYSIDHEKSGPLEIPSITQLLDRRKIEKEQGVTGEPASATELVVPALSEIQIAVIQPQSLSQPQTLARPEIRGAKRVERRAPTRPELWLDLPATNAPAPETAEALARSLKQVAGVQWVLALSPSGALYEPRGMIGGSRLLWGLWAGFRWGAATSPSSHPSLLAARRLELPASGGPAEAKPLRLALGADARCSVWMIAAGPKNAEPAVVWVVCGTDSKAVAGWIDRQAAVLEKAHF